MNSHPDKENLVAVTDAVRARSTAHDAWPSVPAVIAGLALLAVALHVVVPFNHDDASFVLDTGTLLDGGKIGKDVVNMNPPHIYVLAGIPVWIARQIGARGDIITTIFTAVMTAISLLVSDRLIAAGSLSNSVSRVLLPVAAIIVLFAPGYDFGQREHWMVVLTLPYIIARSRRAEDLPVSGVGAVLIGVAACFGFCMKPHYLLVPIALEVWLLIRTRRPFVSIAPETVAMALTGLVYLGIVVVYIPTYFGGELPKALLGYWAYNGTLAEVLWFAVVSVAPAVVLAWLGYTTLQRTERMPTLAQAFAVAGLAFIIAGALQMKPWRYHFMPGIILSYLAAAVLLTAGTARGAVGTFRRGAFVALIAAVCLPSVSELALKLDDRGTAARVERLAAAFRSHAAPGGTVAGFLTSPRDVFPALIASHTTWGVPFCCEYLVAAAVRADERPAAERQALRTAGVDQAERVIAAMRSKEPAVIVIDAGAHKLGFRGRHFDYLSWLNAHTDFADIFRHYREISPVSRFRLFVRK